MMKIIEYDGGTKGDFLTNFLCNRTNISKGANLSLNPITFLKKYSCSQETFENKWEDDIVIDQLCKNSTELAISSHKTDKFSMNVKNFIQKNCQTYKIAYSKNFLKTIRIEEVFKQLTRPTVFNWVKDYVEESLHQKLENMEYSIDIDLVKNGHAITNQNRIDLLHLILTSRLGGDVYYTDPGKVGIPGTTIVDYKDLYINFNLTDKLFAGYDKELFQHQVSQTWLPHTISVFKTVWKPKDYGYRVD